VGASSLCRNVFVQLSIPRRRVRARARDDKETFISREDLIIQRNAAFNAAIMACVRRVSAEAFIPWNFLFSRVRKREHRGRKSRAEA